MYYLYRALKIILYALLLTPFLVWSVFLFPFITTKVIYFRLLVELAFAVYLILAWGSRELRVKWNPITAAVWIFFGVLFLTSLLGVNFYHSFWGTLERGEGLITILHFLLYFTMLTAVLRTKKDWLHFLSAVLIMIFLSACYATAQLFGLFSQLTVGTGTRVAGTIGNASFFAAFMLFGIFLALYLKQFAERRWQRLFLYTAFALQTVILFKTSTRGAIVAGAIVFFLFFLFKIFSGKSARHKVLALAACLVLAAAAALIYFNRDSAFMKRNDALLRLSHISVNDVTTQSRFDTWRASWQGWQERFWTGYGYENYNIAFNKYFPARIFKKPGSQIWFDKAHNILFDIGTVSGIFGLLSYLAIFVIIFWTLWQIGEKAIFLAMGFLTYFLQNLFVFDTQATYLVFFTLLAYVVFLRAQTLSDKPIVLSGQPAFIVVIPVLVATIIAAYYFNLRPALANHSALAGVKATMEGNLTKFLPNFQEALTYHTYMDAEIRQRFADSVLNTSGIDSLPAEERQKIFSFAIEELRKNIAQFPLDVKNYIYLMNVFNRGSTDAAVFQEIVSLGERAIELSPTRSQIYIELGQAFLYQGKFEQGLAHFQKAAELNPETISIRFNYLLAAIIAKEPKIVAAETEIINVKLRHAFDVNDYIGMARAYSRAGDRDQAIKSYRGGLVLEPKRADLHALIAVVYGETCDLEAVRAEIKEILNINSSYASQTAAFMSQLEKNCKK